MDKSSLIIISWVLLVQLITVYFFYKEESKQAMLVSFLLNTFSLSSLILVGDYTEWNPLILVVPLLLIHAAGYRLFLQGGWPKALLVAFVANVAAFGLAFLFQKILH